jgi:hypothetical protein
MDTEIMLSASEMLEILSMEVTIDVPDRQYDTMTPKDCYEAGLMDASTAVREAMRREIRKRYFPEDE